MMTSYVNDPISSRNIAFKFQISFIDYFDDKCLATQGTFQILCEYHFLSMFSKMFYQAILLIYIES